MAQNLQLALSIRADLQQALSQLDNLQQAMADTGRATDTATTATQRNEQGQRTLVGTTQSLAGHLKQVTGLFGAWLAAAQIPRIIAVADAWKEMTARLQLATIGSNELQQAQRELFAIAQRVGVPIQETAALYGKLSHAVRLLGGTQQEALSVTESISQALQVSGASAQESQAALTQLGQALSAGVLRGQDFNSVLSSAPRLMQALADSLNIPLGGLRKLAEEGRLTADVVINALRDQKDTLAAEYAQLPQTVGAAFTRLGNAMAQWIGQLDASIGFTDALAAALNALANNFGTLMQWLERIAKVAIPALLLHSLPALIAAFKTLAATGVAAARSIALQLGYTLVGAFKTLTVAGVTAARGIAAAWAQANAVLSTSSATVGALKLAFGVLGALLLGWEIGTWLSDNFEIARKAGVFMVEMLVKGIEFLRYRWELFVALFTSDTLEAATARHEKRLADMNLIFGQMYAEASRGANAAQAAMHNAATAAEEIAQRLRAVRQGTQEAARHGIEALQTAMGALGSRLDEVEQSVRQTQGVVNATLGQMANTYQGLGDLVEEAMARQTQAIQQRYAEELSVLERTTQSETDRITQSSRLLADALTQETGLRQQATADTLHLIDQEAQARRQAAARMGQNEEERKTHVQQVETAILASKHQALTQALADYRQHVDALNTEVNRHLSEVRRIEDEKRQLSMSTEERIREVLRQGMTDHQANEDRKRQIDELQSQSRQALARGDLEQARQAAQKAMDLASQVASNQAGQAQRSAAARQQAEQAVTQAVALEAQAREARRRGESAQARALDQQAAQLRTQATNATREADQQAAQGKAGVRLAIDRIRQSETLLNQTLDAEALAHRQAAKEATTARDKIEGTIKATAGELQTITALLQDGLTMTLDADTQRIGQALAELDRTLAEKDYLLKIQADMQQAEQTLSNYQTLLEKGQTLPIDANVEQAKATLAELQRYAEDNTQVELQLATETAQTAVSKVEGMIVALGQVQTESQHQVASNAASVRSDIDSLQGRNTTSTHTIYVKKVEAHATGGVVGQSVQHYATGGAVFPAMQGGTVPGTGNQDTVPRTLQSGAFVLRKAAVQKYGRRALARLTQAGARIAHFATGGSVVSPSLHKAKPSAPRTAGAQKKLDLARAKLLELEARLAAHPAKAKHINNETSYYAYYREQAKIKADIEAQNALIKQIEAQLARLQAQTPRDVQAFASGGRALAASDTVPAMLTPGEFVVQRSVVARLGSGFFEALNNLSAPAQALAHGALGTIQGFASGGLVQQAGSPLPPQRADQAPTRTLRVELASGNTVVNAQVAASDEARLLQLLSAARARTQ